MALRDYIYWPRNAAPPLCRCGHGRDAHVRGDEDGWSRRKDDPAAKTSYCGWSMCTCARYMPEES
jgi:hypothetical protein